MKAPVMIHLKEVAELLNVSLTTLYGDWGDRVHARQIPPADGRFARPTWHEEEVKAWLKAPPAITRAEKAKASKPDPEGDALRNRMNRNRDGRSHAA